MWVFTCHSCCTMDFSSETASITIAVSLRLVESVDCLQTVQFIWRLTVYNFEAWKGSSSKPPLPTGLSSSSKNRTVMLEDQAHVLLSVQTEERNHPSVCCHKTNNFAQALLTSCAYIFFQAPGWEELPPPFRLGWAGNLELPPPGTHTGAQSLS